MAVARPKERGVIFGADSVRLILAGKKTQTRRAIKGVPDNARHGEFAAPFGEEHKGWAGGVFFEGANVNSPGVGSIRCPYGKPGDRLWVKETFQPIWAEVDVAPHSLKQPEGWALTYPATDELIEYMSEDNGPTTACMSPLFMPRWASRLTLTITDVRVERLQDISEEDAIAEGVEKLEGYYSPTWRHYGDDGSRQHVALSAKGSYASQWQEINAKRGYPWESNCWVWVVVFKVVS